MEFLLFALLDLWRIRRPDPERVGWLREATYAHRGLHGSGVIENSTSAFAGAIARGLGIECDVQRTADDQAVVFHDFDLDRLTGASGAVIDHSAKQVTAIPLAGTSEPPPLLHQLLAQIGGQVPLLIEVKSRKDLRVAPLCLAVRRVLEGYRGPVAVMSFDPKVARWFGRHSRHVVRGLVVSEEHRRSPWGRLKTRLLIWLAQPDFLAWDVRDLPSRIAGRYRKRGLPLLTWTVRDATGRETAERHADAPIAEGGGLA